MKYFTDGRERTKESTVDMIFYEGNNLISQKDGTFKSSNAINQVNESAWKNDLDLTLTRESSENAVGDKFIIYQCGMYRKLEDDVSSLQLKIGAEVPWVFGYKVYKSLGDFSYDLEDGGDGTLKIIETVSEFNSSWNSIAIASTQLFLAASLLTLSTF